MDPMGRKQGEAVISLWRFLDRLPWDLPTSQPDGSDTRIEQRPSKPPMGLFGPKPWIGYPVATQAQIF